MITYQPLLVQCTHHTNIYIYIHMCVYIYIDMYVYICTYAYIRIYVEISIYTFLCVCVFTLNEQWARGGECIYSNGLVPSCHCEEDGCHKQRDHLTSAAPQLRGVKMLLKLLQNLT